MNKFLLIDASHLFYRARHVVRSGSNEEKVGMCLHILFSSLAKAWRTHQANHVVFAFDGSSWRKNIYKPYKANRTELREMMSEDEQDESRLFFDAFNIFRNFVKDKTNATVLEHPILEADDLISGFISSHPNDYHIIVSSDGDFNQLLSSNVSIYNGVADTTSTVKGIFDYRGKAMLDNKTGKERIPYDPEWSIFEKSLRGCSSDNIFSAYPGIREKGSKNKVGMREAFEDRHKQGFNWNAVMMHRWIDHNGIEHKVGEDYNRNKLLVDLRMQPEEIKKIIFETILNGCVIKAKTQIGLHFLKLCGKFELVKLSDRSSDFSALLSASYPLNK
jgi:hypothetical protein